MRLFFLFALLSCSLFYSFFANAACSSPSASAGTVRYIAPDMMFCDGTDWNSMTVTDTGVSCSNPGEINYSSPNLRFCNGSSRWINMDGANTGTSCSSATPGTLRWNSPNMEWCNGTNWISTTVPVDCVYGSAAIGDGCGDGTIYAGIYGGKRLIVTPGGCTNSANPTCAGGTDTLKKTWRGSTGSNADIAGLDHTTESGSYATGVIVADASVSSDSAADYCNNMNYGGSTDWFLPSIFELASILCHSNGTLAGSYPTQIPSCTAIGGKTTELTGFATSDYYWTSNEHSSSPSSMTQMLGFSDGNTSPSTKSSLKFVRCARDVSDAIMIPINWADFNDTSSSQTISGVNLPITLRFNATGISGTPLVFFRVNGGPWLGYITINNDALFEVVNDDTMEFKVEGNFGDTVQIDITNYNNGDSVVDTTTGTVTIASTDPCLGTPARGTVCSGGAIYAGQFDGGKYMITPGGCSDSTNPTCSGTDTVNKSWGTPTTDLPEITNIASAATPSPSSERGADNQPHIIALMTNTENVNSYCANMVYGGYDDWFLPSKSELAYIYCHANTSNHSTSYPDEDANCAAYGGKTSELLGFITTLSSQYYSSTEKDTGIGAWRQSMYNGRQSSAGGKSGSAYVRCARRY